MKKYYVSSDIHSYYSEWMEALNEAGFDINNKEHCIIVCGDLLDRGDKPLECLKFVNDLHKQGRAILIKGNHEELFENIYERDYFESHDDHNGTIDTYIKLANFNETEETPIHKYQKIVIRDGFHNEEVQYYLNNLVDYYETKKYVFVHGWIPISYTEDTSLPEYMRLWHPVMIKDKNWRKGDWSEARWLNGMEAWHKGIKIRGKTIVCGHWGTSYGHSKYHRDGYSRLSDALWSMEADEIKRMEKATNIEDVIDLYMKYIRYEPFIDKGIIALDASTALSKKVNVIVLEID